MPAPASICPQCGVTLDAAQSGGLCVACLLGEAIDVAEQGAVLGRIAGHDLIEVIARGGMGIVYRARQSDPPREVALKALPGAELMSEEARQRFRIEAQAMAKLHHPAIVPVYEIGEEDGTPFFTMKLALGGTLARRIGDYAGKWREIAELMARIAEAVQVAHSHGVLHRDLKPGNILFDEDGSALVSDFGLAKMIGTDSNLTKTLAMMGTPNYMAPELARKNGVVTTASDVWSLGVILYELLAGHVPFTGDNVPAVLRAVAEDAPAPLHRSTGFQPVGKAGEKELKVRSTPGIPRDLGVITFKALQKDPARRYGTAQELADDLRRWLVGEPIHARPVPLAERAWLWAKRKPTLAAALALWVVTLLISAGVLLRSNQNLRITDAQRRSQIHRALLEKADAERQSMTPGRRERALALVREALTHGTSVQARSVAASALAVSDMRVTQSWRTGRIFDGRNPMHFTPDLEQHLAVVPAEQVRDKTWKEGAIGLWRTADHKLLKQVPLTDRNTLFDPRLSPDGRWACIPAKYKFIEIWDLQQQKRLHTLESTVQASAEFHPTDGTIILCANGALSRVHLPDMRMETLATGLFGSHNLSLSPDGRFAALAQHLPPVEGRRPPTITHVYDLVSGELRRTLPVYSYGDVAWLPGASSFCVFDFNNNELTLNDPANPEVPSLRLLRSYSTGRRVAVWPDARTLAWGDNGGFLHLFDLWQEKEIMLLPATAMSLAVSRDGSRFAYTPDSQSAALGELLPPPILQQRKALAGSERSVDEELALSPDGRWIATADNLGITLWRSENMQPVVNRLAHRPSENIQNLHFSSDSKQLRFNADTTQRTVWDIVETDAGVKLEGPGAGSTPSDHYLNSSSLDGRWEGTAKNSEKASRFYLWRDGEVVGRFKRDLNPHRVDWQSRLLSPDGKWGAWGCMAQEHAAKPGFTYIIHFDRDRHRTMLSWEANHTHLAISPDSRWLVGGESANYVIWDSTTWKPVFRLPADLSDSVPGSAAFSPDGTLLALEVDHGKIRLLRVGSWEEVLTITPPQNLPVVRMAFSPDGKYLYATGGQILHRWDISKLHAELTALGMRR